MPAPQKPRAAEILQALAETAGQKSAAAKLLRISTQTLRRRLARDAALRYAWETRLAASYRTPQNEVRCGKKKLEVPQMVRICSAEESQAFINELNLLRRRPQASPDNIICAATAASAAGREQMRNSHCGSTAARTECLQPGRRTSDGASPCVSS